MALKQEFNLMLFDQGTRLNVIRYFSYQGFSYIILLLCILFSAFIGFLVPDFYAIPLSIMGILVLIIVVFNIIWTIRRLHDINFSGYWILAPVIFGLIAIIFALLPFPADSPTLFVLVSISIFFYGFSQLALFILTLIPGTKGVNKYGEEPEKNNLFNYIFLVVFIIAFILMIIANIVEPDTKETDSKNSPTSVKSN